MPARIREGSVALVSSGVGGGLVRIRFSGMLLLLAMAPCGALADPPQVDVVNALVKVRPADAPPAARAAEISAARNEFEAFQIIVHGGDSGVTGVTATASSLVGPGDAGIPAAEIMLYREGLYNAVYASNSEGATGLWPDALIPAVDAYAKEPRNAFPFDVPVNESRGIWVEVFVPLGTPAGIYQGSVTVKGTGLPASNVPVRLQVRDFELPSTATLKSTFGIGWDGGCLTHLGSYDACGDEGVASYVAMYSRAALDHRISMGGATYGGKRNDNWAYFDRLFGPQIGGTANTRLKGARLTTVGFNEIDISRLQGWRDHFARKGWSDRLYQYTCDEPPGGCSFDSILDRAAPVHAAGVKTLVTTDIDQLNAHSLANSVDILVPIINTMEPYGGKPRRPDYDAFLAVSPAKELWMYQSCMSHGCAPTTHPAFVGWPSYVIDASGVQNRAMEWFSFEFDVTGELYYMTNMHLATAWENQWDFHGNGDGTLFYPGTPKRIGGKSHIPVESIRLKLIREGMEDYEYLHLLCDLGDCASAKATARTLFPAAFQVTRVTPEALYAARAKLADRIEQLWREKPPPAPGTAPGSREAPAGRRR